MASGNDRKAISGKVFVWWGREKEVEGRGKARGCERRGRSSERVKSVMRRGRDSKEDGDEKRQREIARN